MALDATTARLSLLGLKMTGCRAGVLGGALSLKGNWSFPLTISALTANSNIAGSGGGAVAVSAPNTTVKMFNSSFTSNQAGTNGAASPSEVGGESCKKTWYNSFTACWLYPSNTSLLLPLLHINSGNRQGARYSCLLGQKQLSLSVLFRRTQPCQV